MSQKLNIDRIWWRNVQPGEFYNIERYPQIQAAAARSTSRSLRRWFRRPSTSSTRPVPTSRRCQSSPLRPVWLAILVSLVRSSSTARRARECASPGRIASRLRQPVTLPGWPRAASRPRRTTSPTRRQRSRTSRRRLAHLHRKDLRWRVLRGLHQGPASGERDHQQPHVQALPAARLLAA